VIAARRPGTPVPVVAERCVPLSAMVPPSWPNPASRNTTGIPAGSSMQTGNRPHRPAASRLGAPLNRITNQRRGLLGSVNLHPAEGNKRSDPAAANILQNPLAIYANCCQRAGYADKLIGIAADWHVVVPAEAGGMAETYLLGIVEPKPRQSDPSACRTPSASISCPDRNPTP